MQSLKIALLSFEYPPETGFGGIGTYTWYQARALAKLGHEVHVLAGATKSTPLRTEQHDGVTVYRFRSNGLFMKSLHRLEKHRLYWTRNRIENGLCMYQALKNLRQKNKYDIVEMPECGAEGFLINTFTRAKTLIRLHSPARLIMPFYNLRKSDITLCSFIEEWAMRTVGAFSSCSRFLADEARTKLGVKQPIKVIPNGIDLQLFDRSEHVDVRRKFNLPADRPMIFFSGRMENRKGIHLCKEIAASILERYTVACVFAGQDLFNYMSETLLPYLKTKKLKGSVHYLGKLDLTDVRSCLRETDMFLLPSIWENCPYSCLEAMAAECAIVCSNQGGMPELIDDGRNGLLAENQNTAGYIEGLEKLIEDATLRARLGKAARQTIQESYSDIHIANLSTDYYLQCLNNSG